MSGHRIFTSPREVIIQGRNANIAGSMTKRNPIFNHQASDKPQLSPFAGYNFNSSETFSTSQVSQFGNQNIRGSNQNIRGSNAQLGQSNVKELVKEELDKHTFLEEQNKKQISTTQAQINDLKEKFVQFQKNVYKANQQNYLSIKEEIKGLVEKLTNDCSEEIKMNLRKVFQKTNEQLKKEIIKYAKEEFVPISIIDELEQVYEKVELIEEKINSNTIDFNQPARENISSQLSQNLQSKMSKFEREVDALKKSLKDVDAALDELKAVKDDSRQNRELLINLKEKFKGLDHQNEDYSKKLSNLDVAENNLKKDLQLLKEKLGELEKNSDQHRFIIKNLSKKYSSTEDKEEPPSGSVKQFLEGKDNENTSIILNNSAILEKEVQASPGKADQLQAPVRKSLYQIDKDGYLMDEDGKYLLTETNTMLKLSAEQIKLLSQSQLIQFC